MKLSEAIMMNEMTKPQGFGAESMQSVDAPCALGGALQAVGKDQCYLNVWATWPWSDKDKLCPVLHCGFDFQLVNVIAHLNDNHRWTRAQIAEWVATIEPKEEFNEAPVLFDVVSV